MKYIYTDYHVHTKWSHDIKENGPIFEEYALASQENAINICFLDHYEVFYVKNDKTYPFYGGKDKVIEYLAELDKVKENHDHLLSGLEVDYYEEMEEEIAEFLDDFEKEFDFIAGTVHETEYGYPFTTREKLIQLLNEKNQEEIIEKFFRLSRKMIDSGLFKNICHIDTIFRYINENDIKPFKNIEEYDDDILELGRACIGNNIQIEYNISGIRHPIKRPFPSKSMALRLKGEGAKFFIGSDSHSIEVFQASVPLVIEAFNTFNHDK